MSRDGCHVGSITDVSEVSFASLYTGSREGIMTIDTEPVACYHQLVTGSARKVLPGCSCRDWKTGTQHYIFVLKLPFFLRVEIF